MPTPRFLTLDDVAEILNVSWSQAYALVRRKELIAIQIGGRGQWRVEVDELERFIQQKYAEARAGTVPPRPPTGSRRGRGRSDAPGRLRRPGPVSPGPAAAVRTTAIAAMTTARTPCTASARRGRSARVLGELDVVGAHPVQRAGEHAAVVEHDLDGAAVPGQAA